MLFLSRNFKNVLFDVFKFHGNLFSWDISFFSPVWPWKCLALRFFTYLLYNNIWIFILPLLSLYLLTFLWGNILFFPSDALWKKSLTSSLTYLNYILFNIWPIFLIFISIIIYFIPIISCKTSRFYFSFILEEIYHVHFKFLFSLFH